MRMRLGLAAAVLAIGSLVGAAAAEAATYDLTTDYSATDNPNSQGWSYSKSSGSGAGLLPHQSAPNSGSPNHLMPAIPGDYFSSGGNDLNSNNPFLFKAAVNGSSAGLTDGDFLAGDIVVHSPNDGSALVISWTAPTAGTISDLFAAAWYAHSSLATPRSNEVVLSVAGAFIASWTVSSTDNPNRDQPGSFSGGVFSVNAGDLLSLSFTKSLGQTFGSLNGVQMSFNFTPTATTPIPPALPLFASGLVGLGWFGHRKRKQAA